MVIELFGAIFVGVVAGVFNNLEPGIGTEIVEPYGMSNQGILF